VKGLSLLETDAQLKVQNQHIHDPMPETHESQNTVSNIFSYNIIIRLDNVDHDVLSPLL